MFIGTCISLGKGLRYLVFKFDIYLYSTEIKLTKVISVSLFALFQFGKMQIF